MDYQQRKRLNVGSGPVHKPPNGGGEENPLNELKKDLEGWREVMLFLSSLFRWDKPYYPAISAGTITFLFLFIWLADLSTVTTISLVFMLAGILDFAMPFVGPKITALEAWTGTEETQFTEICAQILNTQRDVIETWQGLSAMRQQNPKSFFFVIVGFLSLTAWLGNLLNNLLLTYLLVIFVVLLPGMRHNNVACKFLRPLETIIFKLRKAGQDKQKSS